MLPSEAARCVYCGSAEMTTTSAMMSDGRYCSAKCVAERRLRDEVAMRVLCAFGSADGTGRAWLNTRPDDAADTAFAVASAFMAVRARRER